MSLSKLSPKDRDLVICSKSHLSIYLVKQWYEATSGWL
jgi:hypothetical protein